jgi:hypothetical protein
MFPFFGFSSVSQGPRCQQERKGRTNRRERSSLLGLWEVGGDQLRVDLPDVGQLMVMVEKSLLAEKTFWVGIAIVDF